MSKYTSLVELYTDIADAIREKGGGTTSSGAPRAIYGHEFANEIRNLPLEGEELIDFLSTTSTYFELEEISKVRDYAFYGSPFEEVRLGTTCPKLGRGVFENSALKKYVTPVISNGGTVTESLFFGESCFKNCTELSIVQMRLISPQNLNFDALNLFYNTPIGGLVTTSTTINPDTGETETIETVSAPTGYIYIASKHLLTCQEYYPQYQFRAIEDYSVDGSLSGELDPDKIAATEVNE